ncbi:hepatocyte growth factor-regulated tyrosine kinase substrate isoform X2 [Drosophila sulfurigaster albostrigata]|uniref:hepatocyte growth factor-regulated tyrosine kinase substrate isoform X2 n=1 Tax=Drosophila sulfurigaster albostrigata TaxID=89887 RepID=UPI002D21A9C3|nr:hepatocyte growth factor-regulated tyrosine kinase substrate isoform X2 [Drosophila sulfurigaster albostrigata]
MFRSTFDRNLENATSHLRLEPDWPSILLICDEINQKDVTPKNAFAAIKKKMNSPNPHSACYSLLVLESIVKNCGAPVHDEVFTKENCEMFSSFLEQTPHENVRQKMLELVQTWAYAFRSMDKYQAIKDTMTILKAKGHTFPELKEADAMFTADTAPNWADGKVCHRCRAEFTFTNRKHHCRNCGQVFCGQCTGKQCPLPKYGIEKDVRVCDGCFMALQRPAGAASGKTSSTRVAGDSDLPAEYLNSSLSQQTPARKSEQELKEEEELNLALALSQSEAEQKKQQPISYRMQQRSPSPEAPPVQAQVAVQQQQQEESNPDLAKYLNRSYWEQRKISESSVMASPSAPSPMPPTPQPQQQLPQLLQQAQQMLPAKTADELQIDEFAANMRIQVEIFVNRMKSNSSRGRSISNDSSVQTLFMTLTSLHSQQLSYIKELDDKRMWYEQLQDKLAQIKDSRAALDVLRQEHVEKLRRIAEEQERQRQLQMAQKLEIMRKKKQEYLDYQRQLALQRIQEQEREMQLRQEQQKAQYLMGQQTAPYPYMAAPHGSPSHQLNNVYNPYAAAGGFAAAPNGQFAGGIAPPGMYMMQPDNPYPNPGQANAMMQQLPPQQQPQAPLQQSLQQPQSHQQPPQSLQQPPQSLQQPPQPIQQPQPHLAHVMLQQQQMVQTHSPLANTQAPPQQQQLPPQAAAPPPQQQQQQHAVSAPPQAIEAQVQAVAAAPAPPQNEPEPVKATEPATAELISFD